VVLVVRVVAAQMAVVANSITIVNQTNGILIPLQIAQLLVRQLDAIILARLTYQKFLYAM
jgi:hypothetical protein